MSALAFVRMGASFDTFARAMQQAAVSFGRLSEAWEEATSE